MTSQDRLWEAIHAWAVDECLHGEDVHDSVDHGSIYVLRDAILRVVGMPEGLPDVRELLGRRHEHRIEWVAECKCASQGIGHHYNGRKCLDCGERFPDARSVRSEDK